MLRRNPLAYSISCVLAAGALGTGNLALAQDQDAQDQAEAMVVEEVLVTGSRIKRESGCRGDWGKGRSVVSWGLFVSRDD